MKEDYLTVDDYGQTIGEEDKSLKPCCKKELEKQAKQIFDEIEKGHTCPDCKRKNWKCIERYSIEQIKQKFINSQKKVNEK